MAYRRLSLVLFVSASLYASQPPATLPVDFIEQLPLFSAFADDEFEEFLYWVEHTDDPSETTLSIDAELHDDNE